MTRKYRSQSEWQEIIQHQKDSGLNALAFCRQYGLSSKYFYKRRLEQSTYSSIDTPTSTFIKIKKPADKTTTSPTKSIGMLHYNNSQLQLDSSVDAQWLAQLMQALS